MNIWIMASWIMHKSKLDLWTKISQLAKRLADRLHVCRCISRWQHTSRTPRSFQTAMVTHNSASSLDGHIHPAMLKKQIVSAFSWSMDVLAMKMEFKSSLSGPTLRICYEIYLLKRRSQRLNAAGALRQTVRLQLSLSDMTLVCRHHFLLAEARHWRWLVLGSGIQTE